MIALKDKKVIPINIKLAEQQNNKAMNLCHDNTNAFYTFKKNRLFPTKTQLSYFQDELKKDKEIVKAFKNC